MNDSIFKEAEINTLSAMLTGRQEVFDAITDITEDHFTSRDRKIVFKAIRELNQANSPMDGNLVANQAARFIGQNEAVILVANLSGAMPTSAHIGFYADILRQGKKRRQISMIMETVQSMILNEDETDDIASELEKQAFNLNEIHNKSESVLDSACKTVIAMIEDKLSGKSESGLKTGIEPWDKMLGGLQRSRLYILAARAGKGKTSMIEQMVAEQINNNEPVLVFSQDMDASLLIARMACRKAGVNFMDFERGRLSSIILEDLKSRTESIQSSCLKLYSPINMTVEDMTAITRREKRQNGIKAVYLDHVLCLDVGKRELREGMTIASSKIRQAVQETQLPHVILAQLNREADKVGRPQPSHIKEFDALFADCDVMAMLWTEEDPINVPSHELLLVKLTVNKNRFGAIFEDELGFNRQLAKFVPLTQRKENV